MFGHKVKPEDRSALRKKMLNAGNQFPDRQTNREFASENTGFQRACGLAGVLPTKRQAAKFRRKEGSAYASR